MTCNPTPSLAHATVSQNGTVHPNLQSLLQDAMAAEWRQVTSLADRTRVSNQEHRTAEGGTVGALQTSRKEGNLRKQRIQAILAEALALLEEVGDDVQ